MHPQTLSTSPIPATTAAATFALVEKHSRAIRWMHWINFPLLTLMIWSGLLIYWGDSIPPFQHAHQVYRVGLGHITLFRLFPDWFWKWMNAPYRITVGLGWHFLIMWFFAANGIAYFVYLCLSGEWRILAPTTRSFTEALQVTLYDLHWPSARRRGLPAQGKYNGAQRIAYSAIILMGGLALLTGVAIYKPAQAHWLTTLFGGYEMARWLHFWLTIAFCLFFLLHVVQVALAGWNNFRSMVSGYEIQPASSTSTPDVGAASIAHAPGTMSESAQTPESTRESGVASIAHATGPMGESAQTPDPTPEPSTSESGGPSFPVSLERAGSGLSISAPEAPQEPSPKAP